VALTAVGSAWAGWLAGGFVRAAGEGRPAADLFGSRRRTRAAVAALAALVVAGALAAYRPAELEGSPPASALALAPHTDFDHRDAVFWEAQLPDAWRSPGEHRTYQEGIVDGRPFPLGPAWCARDEAELARQLPAVRLGLSVNGEVVPLDGFPAVLRRMRDGAVCHWIAVSAMAPRPGRYTLAYAVDYAEKIETDGGAVGPGTARVVIDLAIKPP
jgi:hypothetical protein